MPGYSQSPAELHEYHMKRWMQVLSGCLGLFLLGIGVTGAVAARRDNTAALMLTMVPLALSGIYLLALIFRSRLVIEGSRLEYRGVFREQNAELNEIEGFRTVNTRNGSYQQIWLKDNRGKVTIPQHFDTDDDFHAWLRQLTDLDLRDRNILLSEIKRSDALGATPGERMRAVARAKRWNIALIVLCCGAAAGLNLGPSSVQPISALVLAVIPVAIIVLIQQAPLLYTIGKPKRDPRADLLTAFAFAGVGLLITSDRMQFVSIQPLLVLAVPLFIGVLLAFGTQVWSSKSRWGLLFGVVLFGAMYSYGAAVTADTLPDHAQPVFYSSTVAGKRVSHGRSSTYYLELAPWGPVSQFKEMSVGSNIYSEFAIGAVVCLALRPGTMHAGWYQLFPCPSATGLNPTL